jgi:ABC-type phosphate transport system substrate-binding protein
MQSNSFTLSFLQLLGGFVFFALGCAKDPVAVGTATQAATPAPPAAAGGVVTLQGSGASFPAPIYSRWFREFGAKNPTVRVNYQSTGSGAGIKAFVEGQTGRKLWPAGSKTPRACLLPAYRRGQGE